MNDPQRITLGAIMAALGGGHTIDTVPDEVTPYRTEDGGWSTRALERYLDAHLAHLDGADSAEGLRDADGHGEPAP